MVNPIELADLLNLAREFPLFHPLSDECLAKILSIGFLQSGSPGQYLTRRHEQADSFYLILKGRVEVLGKNRTPIAWLGPGELIGEMAFFEAERRRLADCLVIKSARLLQVSYGTIRRLFENDPEVAQAFLPTLETVARSRGLGTPSAALASVNGQSDKPETAVPGPSHSPPRSKSTLVKGPLLPLPHEGMVALVPTQVTAALSRCLIFDGFADEDLAKVVALGKAVRIAAHDALFLEGEPADSLYILALGRLGVVVPGGSPDNLVAQIFHGHCVGETPLALGLAVRSASVIALATSSLVQIPYPALLEFLRSNLTAQEQFEANLARLTAMRA